MSNKAKTKDATYNSDISGLKLDKSKSYTNSDIYFHEAKNILKTSIRYLSDTPSSRLAPFDYDFFLRVHKEMFADVWNWAGKLRTVELNFGVKAYQVSTELKKLGGRS